MRFWPICWLRCWPPGRMQTTACRMERWKYAPWGQSILRRRFVYICFDDVDIFLDVDVCGGWWRCRRSRRLRLMAVGRNKISYDHHSKCCRLLFATPTFWKRTAPSQGEREKLTFCGHIGWSVQIEYWWWGWGWSMMLMFMMFRLRFRLMVRLMLILM